MGSSGRLSLQVKRKGDAQTSITSVFRRKVEIGGEGGKPSLAGAGGLLNLGNTCYANSVVQVLRHSKQMEEFIYSAAEAADGNEAEGAVCKSLYSLMQELRLRDGASAQGAMQDPAAIRPDEFLTAMRSIAPHFTAFEQQDAHEFLRILTECLASGRETDALLRGQLVNRTRCLECECVSHRTEDFVDIGISVSPSSTSLTHALDVYTRAELLGGADKVHCETCRRPTEMERSVQFGRLPQLLVFHLERFSHVGGGKLQAPLASPGTISMRDWCATHCPEREGAYEFYGVVTHAGVSSTSGHYVALVKPDADTAKGFGLAGDAWLRFDDADVRVVTPAAFAQLMGPSNQSSETSYLLFYRPVKA